MDSPNGTRQEGTFEIYHRLVLCNFIRIKKGGPNDGVFIIIQDKNNIKKSLEAETAFIGELENATRRLSSSWTSTGKSISKDFSAVLPR